MRPDCKVSKMIEAEWVRDSNRAVLSVDIGVVEFE